ncbi:HpcH/HpaI aldolase/citrate lyase family protein [Rhizobium alvei]|uniref:CoA ester lyase n=1 Tax=Rhizobium alvei TaxID=1132659 RepID=A0ABT8YR32_9HYPH|nr:CoA ester lyase [Rhizobium alvei]MDO6966184.1 CoA ester lyase [Rhizobium alvei]
MTSSPELASLFLFVPADRPERFAKAAASGADAIIIDLEDAVAADQKAPARAALTSHDDALRNAGRPVFIRINGTTTRWHDDDLAAVERLAVSGIILPKAESASTLAALRQRLAGKLLIALVETAAGLSSVDEIATACDRIAFGSVDYAADLGCAHHRDALLLARSRIVLAARLASQPQPIDGVTLSIKDDEAVEQDARYAMKLGFGAKLLIHPAQVIAARRGFSPSAEEISWAEKVVATNLDGAASAINGIMIDAPVLARARQILERQTRLTNG